MWTITDKQIAAISNSMRTEFEKRAIYFFSKEDGCIPKFSEEEIKQNIHQQTEYLIRYQITSEALALEFFKLSFFYPAMREASFSETLHHVFLEADNEQEKIDNLVIHLNENDYVSEL